MFLVVTNRLDFLVFIISSKLRYRRYANFLFALEGVLEYSDQQRVFLQAGCNVINLRASFSSGEGQSAETPGRDRGKVGVGYGTVKLNYELGDDSAYLKLITQQRADLQYSKRSWRQDDAIDL